MERAPSSVPLDRLDGAFHLDDLGLFLLRPAPASPAHPPAEWTTQQIVEAFPWGDVPRYLLRDRDGVYGRYFRDRGVDMGIEEVMTAPRSPWQNPGGSQNRTRHG